MSPNDAVGITNSVDPDQTAPRSSLIWVCNVCSGRKLRISTVVLITSLPLGSMYVGPNILICHFVYRFMSLLDGLGTLTTYFFHILRVWIAKALTIERGNNGFALAFAMLLYDK